MTYNYAVIRGGLVLDRTLTVHRARRIARTYNGAAAVALPFVVGCELPGHGGLTPCDIGDCGKNLNGGK